MKLRVGQQVQHHDRRAHDHGDLLFPDQSQGLGRIPLIHDVQAAPVVHIDDELGKKTADVEQGHCQQGLCGHSRCQLAVHRLLVGHIGGGPHKLQVHQ